MSDPIPGSLIHNFVYETQYDQVNYEDAVYFKFFENGEKDTFFTEGKKNGEGKGKKYLVNTLSEPEPQAKDSRCKP